MLFGHIGVDVRQLTLRVVSLSMDINLKVIKKMPKKTRAVVCMKWGSLYPSEYVNVLYNAVKANLKSEYRFICFTDNHAGLLPEILAIRRLAKN